jgi:hypothetical protein
LKKRYAEQIRYGLLLARQHFGAPMSPQQAEWIRICGHMKMWLLDTKLENAAHWREYVKLQAVYGEPW